MHLMTLLPSTFESRLSQYSVLCILIYAVTLVKALGGVKPDTVTQSNLDV